MIERDPDGEVFEVTCDECSDGYETFDVDDGWADMIADMKSKGWKIIPIDDGQDFEHHCPDCSAPTIETVEDIFRDIFR